MKPSERIKDIADGYVANYPEAIMFFLDEQAELLETHTVKEEKCVCGEKLLLVCDGCNFTKESCHCQPATPEKKCCPCPEKIDECRGECLCHHQEKLQTYFYKVTCGRCEKSIKLKHSCGRV